MCVSFAQVKSHIHTYLKNLEENLLDIEDRTELYLLFVNCFQVKTDRLSFPFSALCNFHLGCLYLYIKFM